MQYSLLKEHFSYSCENGHAYVYIYVCVDGISCCG